MYLEALTASQVDQHQLAVLLHGLPSRIEATAHGGGGASVEQWSGLEVKGHDAVAARGVLVQPMGPEPEKTGWALVCGVVERSMEDARCVFER